MLQNSYYPLFQAVDKALDSRNRLVHHCLLFGIQLELNDPLHALLAENGGNANIIAVHPELTLEVAAGRENALLVLEDLLGHGNGRGGR